MLQWSVVCIVYLDIHAPLTPPLECIVRNISSVFGFVLVQSLICSFKEPFVFL